MDLIRFYWSLFYKTLGKLRFLLLLTLSLTVLSGAIHPSQAKTESAIKCERLEFNLGDMGPSVSIEHNQFMALTKALRATLAGNLATVFRSEWKTKLTVQESNTLVYEIAKSYLDPENFAKVMDGLNVQQDSFVRKVHKRLFELRDVSSKIFTVRDSPPPKGVTDTTFTYYTRSIKNADGNGEGKHQVRVRSYMRVVKTKDLGTLPIGQKIDGFSADGLPFLLIKEGDDLFTLGHPEGLRETLTLAEIKKRFHKSIIFYAPHGKKFKLEIKTALLDDISDAAYPTLGGPHMVQKLDLSLTPKQVSELFAPIESSNDVEKQKISNQRIDQLADFLKKSQPDQTSRIEAVLNVLRVGVNKDPNYLNIEGATLYHRSAFESSLGFQLTVDRSQSVLVGPQMYSDKQLRTPMDLMVSGQVRMASANAARHVELKFPVHAVKSLLGIHLSDPASEAQIPQTEVSPELLKVLQIYAPSAVPQHPGKFHFLQSNGLDLPSDSDIDFIVGD
jgi:hypothetical protein